MGESAYWEYYELGRLPEKPVLLVGIPDVGLVGPIATSFIVKSLNLSVVGYLDSEFLPPVILFHESRPYTPLRIYAKGANGPNIAVFFAETAIPLQGLHSLSSFIVNFSRRRRIEKVVLIGGIAVPNRMQIKKPKVYAAAIDQGDRDLLEKQGFELFKEGFIGGGYALILKYCLKMGYPGIALLAESYLNYPDPGAAAAVLEKLQPLLGLELDLTPLLEKEEEIRVKLRELMKRTMESMPRAGKEYEFTLPPMYA